jgi:diguanylate cyclase (GGDEF)-like protein/PAS domain S-box-containing protein
MMSNYISSSDAYLLNELKLMKEKIDGFSGTAFMRLMYELQFYQIEIEIQRRELLKVQLELDETRGLREELYEFSPLGCFSFDSHGAILDMNQAASTLLGKDRGSLLGDSFVKYIARHDRSNFLVYLHRCLSCELNNAAEFELALADGKLIKVKTSRVGSISGSENKTACHMSFMDVTEFRIAELKLRLTSQVIESAREGIMLTDAQRRIVAANASFLKMTGYDLDEIIGQTPSILNSGRHDATFYKEMNRSFVVNDGWQGEIWNKRKNGDIYQEWANIKVVRKNDGEIDCYIGVFSDISNQEAISHKATELAYYDELTGLANRSLLYDRLHHALIQSRRDGSLMALVFLDLNHFKDIKGMIVHSAGDFVLKEAAARLAYCIREGDTLSRLGGSEFVAILQRVEDKDVLAQIATRIMKALEKPFLIEDNELFVTSSLGITIYPEDGDDMTVLLKNTDTAMHHAKSLGGSNFQFYDASMRPQSGVDNSRIYHA